MMTSTYIQLIRLLCSVVQAKPAMMVEAAA